MPAGEDQVGYQPMAKTEAEPEGNETEGNEIDLPEDIYGAAMYSIVFDFHELFGVKGFGKDKLTRRMNLVRLLFIHVVLFTNFALQGGMLYWIYSYVVLPSVHSVEAVYQDYHAEVFDADGTKNPAKWDAWDDAKKDELCNIAFASYWFMFAILCLWVYSMLIEVRKTERLQRDIKAVEDCTHLHDMIEDKGEAIHIVKITCVIDWLIYLVIIVPKAAIGYGLLLIGCVWLMATDSFSDLILNAVALEFVVNIDNLLFEAAMPLSVINDMAKTKFWIKAGSQSEADRDKKIQQGYFRSMFYFFGVWVLVALMMSFGQKIPYAGVFPDYANDVSCPVYQEQLTKRICMPGQDCFPFGK
jgi:hypothetical protein